MFDDGYALLVVLMNQMSMNGNSICRRCFSLSDERGLLGEKFLNAF